MGNVDIRPDLCAEGGGLLDDFDGTITFLAFVQWDYDGKIPAPVTLLRAVIETAEGGEDQELLSIGGWGAPVEFIPDDTGFGLNKLGSKGKLTKTCNAVRFLDSFVQAGFPKSRIEPRDVSAVLGTTGHFLRHAIDMSGIQKKDNEREKTVLLCTKVNQLPWDTGKSKVSGKGKASAKVDEGLADTMTEIIQGVVIDNDGSVSKKELLSVLFKHEAILALPDKKAALNLASDDTFLKGRDEWTLEDGVLKMG